MDNNSTEVNIIITIVWEKKHVQCDHCDFKKETSNRIATLMVKF